MSAQQDNNDNIEENTSETPDWVNTAAELPVTEADLENSGQNEPTAGNNAADAEATTAFTDENMAERDDSTNTPENPGENSTDGNEKTASMDEGTAETGDKSTDLAAQLAETRDQLLRKAADFENFRKRMNLEKQRSIEYANESLLLDIIPIIDDFERAIQSAQASGELTGLPAGKALLDGIEMIEKRLVSQLENKWGLKRFNSAGELFDPNIHEAVLMEKSPDVEEALVQEDLVKGYMLKDRVIRAAKVKVIMPA